MEPSRQKGKRPGRPKGSPNKSSTFRLPKEILDQLAQLARDQERSQTTLVRRALEAYIKAQQQQDGNI